jgi:uncharacterized Ntn-hydrolase superfamily protein
VRRLLLSVICLLATACTALATFSIVAVDSATGEVGGAGASCIDNSRMIDDLIEGYAAAHTQALYSAANQGYLRSLLILGCAPADIVDSLIEHDAGRDPTIRQYGIVDLVNGGRSAAFTGDSCTAWAGHRTGSNYAIQGNILLGPQIVDTMEYAFTHTTGALATRLKAALDAARTPGADTRCAPNGKSAISSFLRVIRINDDINFPYANLVVPTTAQFTDPIDVLDTLYLRWLDTLSTSGDPFLSTLTVARDTLLADGIDTTLITIIPRNNQGQVLGAGASLWAWTYFSAPVSDPVYQGDSVWTAILTSLPAPGTDTLYVNSSSGMRISDLWTRPIVHYVESTSTSSSHAIPKSFGLQSVFPNPFNSTSRIEFDLDRTQSIELAVYDLLGRRTAVLQQGMAAAGSHTLEWSPRGIVSGIYFVCLRSSRAQSIQKIMLLK